MLHRCGFADDESKHLQAIVSVEKTERGNKGTVIELINKGHTFDWDEEGKELVEVKTQWSKQRKQTALPPFLLYLLLYVSQSLRDWRVGVYVGRMIVVVKGDYLMGWVHQGRAWLPRQLSAFW
jgi:hypothetical protein